MRINRNYKSKDPVYSSGTLQMTSGESVLALSEGQYNDDREELKNLRQKYEQHQETDREWKKLEEEQSECEQKIINSIHELQEKATETSMIYKLEEMEGMLRDLARKREDSREERDTQKRILMGRIEDKEAQCRKYEAERRNQEWG